MDAAVLAWARSQPASSDAYKLASAYVSGVEAVRFSDGRQVTYRSVEHMADALSALYGAENVAMRRPAVSFAAVRRGW